VIRSASWLKQADYDMETAEFLAKGGRHFYAVFMCHLGLEKALKGLYHSRDGKKRPPRRTTLSI
jgi:HEPN domain-containing protein